MATVMLVNDQKLNSFFDDVTKPALKNSSVTNEQLKSVVPFLDPQEYVDKVTQQTLDREVALETKLPETTVSIPHLVKEHGFANSLHGFFSAKSPEKQELAAKEKQALDTEKPAEETKTADKSQDNDQQFKP